MSSRRNKEGTYYEPDISYPINKFPGLQDYQYTGGINGQPLRNLENFPIYFDEDDGTLTNLVPGLYFIVATVVFRENASNLGGAIWISEGPRNIVWTDLSKTHRTSIQCSYMKNFTLGETFQAKIYSEFADADVVCENVEGNISNILVQKIH
jgi:hypothetical protein